MMCAPYKGPNMSSSFNEIGSEFWIESEPDVLLTVRDGLYCLSGRTAIDLILQDILKNKSVKRVAVPAWCCDSMIAPFLDRGVEVEFYDISFADGQLVCHIDDTKGSDVFYLTNYFGYENMPPIEMVRRIKEQGSIIIYDRTHSFLMEDELYRLLADYSFASIRKWMGVIGGAVVEGVDTPEMINCPFVPIKELSMRDKYRYLLGERIIRKDDFLSAFGEFSHCLTTDYRDYRMDDLSYTLYKSEDLKEMKLKRRENATFIHENLKGLQFVCKLTEDAVPLFVPVLFETKEQRDTVRRKLIEQQIYCPVHWPQPVQIPAGYQVNDIVDRELSLLCDQRYGLKEMKKQIKTIMRLL